jgi:hypothetical protein
MCGTESRSYLSVILGISGVEPSGFGFRLKSGLHNVKTILALKYKGLGVTHLTVRTPLVN